MEKMKIKKHQYLHFCLKHYVKIDIFEKKYCLITLCLFQKKLINIK